MTRVSNAGTVRDATTSYPSNFKSAYLLPAYHNVTQKDFLYTIACRTFGLRGYSSVCVTGLRRMVRLLPQITFQIHSICRIVRSKVFTHGKLTEVEEGIRAFQAILSMHKSLAKEESPRLIDKEDIECVSQLLGSMTPQAIDAMEWQLNFPVGRFLWILRDFTILRDETALRSLKEKCAKVKLVGEKCEFTCKFTHREAALLVCYPQLEKLLTCLSLDIPPARELLQRIHAIPQARVISDAIAKELSSQFQHGDILIDDVPLKIGLMGLHLRTELQRVYLTQGNEFHMGIFYGGPAKEIKENMMGIMGYLQKPLLPRDLFPFTALRLKNSALREKVAVMSTERIDSEIHNFAEQCKAWLDLHTNPETKELRRALFTDRESCTSFVAKIVVNALCECAPLVDNPFAGYDLNYMTPNAIKRCLVDAGLAEVSATPSGASYSFL